MTDYALLRRDEAFLRELPWPQHTRRDSVQGHDARHAQHHDFSHTSVESGSDATDAHAADVAAFPSRGGRR